MRRRVVMSDDKTAKAFMKPHSPRRGSATNGSGADSLGGGGSGSNGKDLSQYEIEKKVLAAFSQSTSCLHLSFAQALSMD